MQHNELYTFIFIPHHFNLFLMKHLLKQGNVVLMERGECSFVSKAIRAQEAGAVAAIITDQVRQTMICVQPVFLNDII